MLTNAAEMSKKAISFCRNFLWRDTKNSTAKSKKSRFLSKQSNSLPIGGKRFYLVFLFFAVSFFCAEAQSSFLNPLGNYKANDLMASYSFSVFDVHENLMYADGEGMVYCFDLTTNEAIQTYNKPAGYVAYSGFITVSPDGTEFWAGYTTTGNTDDRIYAVDTETGQWTLKANLTANFDLEFVGGQILVSALNSVNWGDPNCIFLLDISGNNNHRKIIETGGSPAGFSIGNQGDLYYGTSFFTGANALYRWNAQQLNEVIGNAGAAYLTLDDAVKLTDLPAGAYDCVADDAENIAFNFNDFSGYKILAKWNGNSGGGLNFDTIAFAQNPSDWLTMVKATGNFESHQSGNHLFVASFGRPVAEVHADYAPVLVQNIPNFSGFEGTVINSYNLDSHFIDPDDNQSFIYELILNSNPETAQLAVDGNNLMISFLSAGQTNIGIEASSAGQSLTTSFVVGSYPQIEGDYEVSDFENLSLEPDSYWNGSDLSGTFTSGLLNFPNDYNPNWASWSGWAYSNMADDSTAGYLNQYSAITAQGFEEATSEGVNYAVAYVPIDFVSSENIPVPVYFNDNAAHEVKGMFVTNSTYAALTMEYGDDFTEKFGGITGNDPDYFKLLIYGYADGNQTAPVEFFLADYRFEDHSMDYIIKTWQWVELSTLGEVDSLKFSLSSSDAGVYGMNTPGYFCVDQLYVNPESTFVNELITGRNLKLEISPNPASGFTHIKFDSREFAALQIFDFSGHLVFEKDRYQSGEFIPLAGFKNGYYLVRVKGLKSVYTSTFVKQ